MSMPSGFNNLGLGVSDVGFGVSGCEFIREGELCKVVRAGIRERALEVAERGLKNFYDHPSRFDCSFLQITA